MNPKYILLALLLSLGVAQARVDGRGVGNAKYATTNWVVNGRSLVNGRLVPRQGAATLPSNGLLAFLDGYYKFDEAATSGALDSSSSNITLAKTGTPTSITGLLGPCRHVSTGNRFSASNAIFYKYGDQDLTFAGWVRPQSVTGTQAIFSKYDTASQRSYELRLTTTTFGFVLCTDGVSAAVLPFSGLTAAINTWYFVCCRYTAVPDLMEISVTPAATEQVVRPFAPTTFIGGPMQQSTAVFSFGCDFNSGTSSSPFNGDIDEWGIWVRTLSGPDVDKLYNKGVPFGFGNFTL